jgi:hypothetical protein
MNRADKASRVLAAPKAIRLRERARSLKGQAEDLLKKADILLAEAEKIEAAEEPAKRKPREDSFPASLV